MRRVLLDRSIFTDYGQFSLEWAQDAWDGDADRFFAGQENGWVGAAVDGVVHVVLARRHGGSAVRVELWSDEPASDPEWQDVVEVSMSVPVGAGVVWVTWAGEETGDLDLPAGDYRLRALADGRDAGRGGEFSEGIVDHYLLQLWPAEPAPDSVIRVGSDDAAYWHREWGQRRRHRGDGSESDRVTPSA